MTAVDRKGRVAARGIVAALGWPPGTQLDVRERAGLFTLNAPQSQSNSAALPSRAAAANNADASWKRPSGPRARASKPTGRASASDTMGWKTGSINRPARTAAKPSSSRYRTSVGNTPP
ncbi:hypothetical protein O7635_24345 [Asanoa sp. WMMD1127]|uniref:hypothetical protein n=1 Tax=Asanoa sp. WMMD1127 TaxID=3016107 RepID=UPI0024177018|nr:hypothetical protein [Asanoa sp. WMMD1127]MDG4824991.1 hypothetical protein [Asanoa sp. WMMD1127]